MHKRKLPAGQANICGKRVRLGRELQDPQISKNDLAQRLCQRGLEVTPRIISEIEAGNRRVCDGELLALARALNVTVDWLCELTDDPTPGPRNPAPRAVAHRPEEHSDAAHQ